MAEARQRAPSVGIASVLGVAAVIGLLALGFIRGSGPGSTPLARAPQVVLISVPGLRWQDLDAIPTTHVAALVPGTAVLSVRSIGSETSLLEGYLALGAGNRLDSDPTDELADELADASARCLPELMAQATERADDGLNGAEPGALGSALHAARRSTAVFGSTSAVAALMAQDGCVDDHRPVADAAFDADVTLVELAGLDTTTSAAQRADALRAIDRSVGDLSLPADATVVLFAPSATGDTGEVLVIGVRDVPADVGGVTSLVSPSTRRSGYVQLTDIGPTVLDVLSLDVPSAMSGTPIAATHADQSSVDARITHLADVGERVTFRDKAVGPVSVVLAVLMALCGLLALARRHRVARTLAPIVMAYPTITFLMGLVAYHQLPLDFVVVAVPVVSAFVAAVVVGWTSRWGPNAPVTVLAGALWLTMVVDIVTGGTLQINTPLGYSPTIAGRFQGFGNLSFGLVGGAAMVVAVVAMTWPRLGMRPVGWALWVAAVTVVVDAAPAFGSDVGGTLALVPAFAALLMVVSGRRPRPARVALAGVATLAVVAVLAFVDRSRAPSSRTHLGRFLDDLIDGDGWLTIRRKLHGNLAILTSSFWSIVLVVVIVLLAIWASRNTHVVARLVQDRPSVSAFLTGFTIVAALGFALNDSGLAVPAIMLDVAIPWLVATLVPVVRRAGR